MLGGARGLGVVCSHEVDLDHLRGFHVEGRMHKELNLCMRVFSPSMISRRSSAPHLLHPTSSIGAAFSAFLATSAGLGSIALSMTGCGPSIPPPRDRLRTTEAAIAVAEKSGADKVPNAAEVLVNARGGVARAKASMADGKNREAEALLVRAGAPRRSHPY